MKEFDEREYFEAEIQPDIEKLFAKLKLHNIPAYFSACIANDAKESNYSTELLSPDVAERILTEDRFPKYVDINLGFSTVPNNPLEFEYEARKTDEK